MSKHSRASTTSQRMEYDPDARRLSLKHSIHNYLSHQNAINNTIPEKVNNIRRHSNAKSGSDKETEPSCVPTLTKITSISIAEISKRAQKLRAEQTKSNLKCEYVERNIEADLEKWLAEMGPRSVVQRKCKGKEFDQLVEENKAVWIERQSSVKAQLDCVKERVVEHGLGLELFYEQRDTFINEEQARRLALIEDGSFNYNIDPADMGWKTDLLYLQPKYHSIETKYEVMIDRVVNKDLKERLRLLLNDYRRMHLHSKFLADTDPVPKHLDDIRVWIQDTIPDGPTVVDTSKKTKETYENVCSDIRKVKELQDEIIGLTDLFHTASRETNNNVMFEHNKVLRMKMNNTVVADLSILEANHAVSLTNQFKETLEGLMYEEEQLDDARETVNNFTMKIQDVDIKIAEADAEFEAISQLKNKKTSLTPIFANFLAGFSPAVVKTVDPMLRVLGEMAGNERDQQRSVEDSKAAVIENEEKLKKAKQKLKGEKMSTANDDFIFSETASKIRNRDLMSVVSVIVGAIDTYRNAVGPYYERAMERLHNEKQNVKTAKPTDMDAGDIKDVYENQLMDQELSLHGKILTVFRMTEYMTSELNRLMIDTPKHVLNVILEPQRNLAIVSDLVNCAGPMVKRNMAEMAATTGLGISGEKSKAKLMGRKGSRKGSRKHSMIPPNTNASASSKQQQQQQQQLKLQTQLQQQQQQQQQYKQEQQEQHRNTSTVLRYSGSVLPDAVRRSQCNSCDVSEKSSIISDVSEQSSNVSDVTSVPQPEKPGCINKSHIAKKYVQNTHRNTTATRKRSVSKKLSSRNLHRYRSSSITSNTPFAMTNSLKSVSRSNM